MKTRSILLAGVLSVVAFTAHAATREELKREREAIEAEHARRAESCKTQFVVTPCLDNVRIEKQKALSYVSAQENALDATERQAKAEARKRRLADKAVGAEAAASAVPAPQPAASAAPKAARKSAKSRQKSAPSQEDRSAREQEKREAFEARQREIEAHRADVEQRNAKRALSKPAPRPLPPPASAAS